MTVYREKILPKKQKLVQYKVASTGKVYQFSLPYTSPPSRVYTPNTVTESIEIRSKMPAKMGWLRHVLTILSVVIFVSFHDIVIHNWGVEKYPLINGKLST